MDLETVRVPARYRDLAAADHSGVPRGTQGSFGEFCLSLRSLTLLLAVYLTIGLPSLFASDAAAVQDEAAQVHAKQTLYVTEYRVRGATVLDASSIERAVYPFLGPERSVEDIEGARMALEKAYHDRGYQSALVQLPEQDGKGGIIYLDVAERPVGRLRVKNSRFFLLSEVKKSAPSMAEGRVSNFSDVTRDIVRLNQWPDRQIKPELKEGVAPNTVDIDLLVEDTFPLHGSLELNNRYSPDTSPLRLNGYLAYTNLLQLGHTLGVNFQISPEDLDEVSVVSAYYLARVPDWESTSLMFTGTIQDSNVSTLGGTAVAGRGKIFGASFLFNLPPEDHFYHSLRFGLDYKRFDQDLTFGGETTKAPVDYFPFILDYTAGWVKDEKETSLRTALTWNPRGLGSSPGDFDSRRYGANGSFIHAHGELSHQRNLPGDFQFFTRLQGQIADSPLIDSEQITGGGLTSVRGYLESEATGDQGLFATIEFLTPALFGEGSEGEGDQAPGVKKSGGDEKFSVRLYSFLEGGKLWLREPLPEQTDEFELASYGFGGRLSLSDTLHGSIDIGSPLISLDDSHAGDWRLMFRVWGEF